MNKKLIRLTESDLHRIVKESVDKVLNEINVVGKIDDFDRKKGYDGSKFKKSKKTSRPSYYDVFDEYKGMNNAAMGFIMSNYKSPKLGQALIDFGEDNDIEGWEDEDMASYAKKIAWMIRRGEL